jgi:hypothetical protein
MKPRKIEIGSGASQTINAAPERDEQVEHQPQRESEAA